MVSVRAVVPLGMTVKQVGQVGGWFRLQIFYLVYRIEGLESVSAAIVKDSAFLTMLEVHIVHFFCNRSCW